MPEFAFENQGVNTFLVYAVKPEDQLDSMTLGMLTHNKISGLAATTFTQMDTEKYLKYNISAKVSVKQFFSGPVNRKRLMGVFNGIADAMLSAEEYMIDPNSVLLNAEYIFADVSTCETVLVCLPIEGLEDNPDLSSFFKNVMFSTQFDQTENCDHVAKIINYLNSAPTFSLTDFKALLDKLDKSQTVQAPSARTVPPASSSGTRIQPPASREPLRQQTPARSPVAQPAVSLQPPSQSAPPAAARTVPPTYGQSVGSVPSAASGNEEEITLNYLLSHYDKENAAKYKAQQKAKKALEAGNKKGKESKTKDKKDKKNKNDTSNAAFAVPGASKDFGFAVPGQNQSLPGAGVVNDMAAQASPAVSAPQPKVQQTVSSLPKVNPVISSQPAVSSQPVISAPSSPVSAPAASFSPPKINFGETTILTSAKYGETTVLGAVQNDTTQPHPYLVRQKNNEKIMINKPVFRIGKEKSYVDYFIGDNSAISRSHANIVSRDGSYFVVDTNSTNHTYVNGSMIGSNVEVPIDHGMIIGFANESFEFKLY